MIKKLFLLAAVFGVLGACAKQCSKKTYCSVGANDHETY